MTALSASAPHPSAVELRCWILADYRELRLLRAALREALLERPPAEADSTDRMTVVVTELATNALRHGLPPTVVRLLLVEDQLVLDVADRDLEAEPHFDLNRPLGGGGHGLLLALTFAIEVGWYRTDVAKHVWASFST